MGLRPLNDTIFGEIVEDESEDSELAEMLETAHNSFITTIANPSSEFEPDGRGMVAELSRTVKRSYQCRVTELGPDCKDLNVGDIAILPPKVGTMLTVIDEEKDPPEYKRVYAVSFGPNRSIRKSRIGRYQFMGHHNLHHLRDDFFPRDSNGHHLRG